MGNGRIRKRENKFTQVSNALAQDPTISLKCKGLYLLINSLLTIPDWVLYKSYLKSQCKEGEIAFESTWQELKGSSWLKQYKIQGEDGKFYYEYELLDEKEPCSDAQEPGNKPKKKKTTPHKTEGVVNPGVENSPPGDARGGKQGVYNKTDFKKTGNNNTQEKKTNTHITAAKEQLKENKQETTLCVDTSLTLEQLQREIKIVVGAVVGIPTLERLVHSVGKERICYHLTNWPTHRKNQTKKGAGYFITVVENDIEPIEPEQKQQYYNNGQKPQRDNFEQRQYTDEEFESFYADLGT